MYLTNLLFGSIFRFMSPSKHFRTSERHRDYTKALAQNKNSHGKFITDRRAVHLHPDNLESFADKHRGVEDDIELMTIETLIEAALLSDDCRQIARCTDKAVERLGLLRNKSKRFDVASDATLRAEVIDAYLPFYGILADTKKLPEHKISERVMEKLVDVALNVSDRWDDYEHKLRQNHDVTQLTGCAAELGALMLLQRFAVEKIGDGSWWPAPTTVTDARLHSSGSQWNSNWDISVLTQLSETPELSYRLEVKSSQAALERSNRSYDDDIHVVAFREEVLTGESGGAWPLRKMLTLFDSANHQPRVLCRNPDSVLDDMTNRLLDKLES